MGGSSHPQWQGWLAVPGNVCVSIVSGIFSLFTCISLSAPGASYLNMGNLPLKLTVRKNETCHLQRPVAPSSPSPGMIRMNMQVWQGMSVHLAMAVPTHVQWLFLCQSHRRQLSSSLYNRMSSHSYQQFSSLSWPQFHVLWHIKLMSQWLHMSFKLILLLSMLAGISHLLCWLKSV